MALLHLIHNHTVFVINYTNFSTDFGPVKLYIRLNSVMKDIYTSAHPESS